MTFHRNTRNPEINLTPATKKYSVPDPEPTASRDRDPAPMKKVEWTNERRFNHSQALRAARLKR